MGEDVVTRKKHDKSDTVHIKNVGNCLAMAVLSYCPLPSEAKTHNHGGGS